MLKMKLYSMTDSPPCLGVKMTLKYLDLLDKTNVYEMDFAGSEHLTEDYKKKNAQCEVPFLDDNGFLLSESAPIHQYLAEQYGKDKPGFYPTEPRQRAIINHLLAFNLSTYYNAMWNYMVMPIFYAYPRTEYTNKRLAHAISVFDDLLKRRGTKFAASDELTIADCALFGGTQVLEAVRYDLTPYPNIVKWYDTIKKEHPALWEVVQPGNAEMRGYYDNPPDLSHVKHPIHPTGKV